MVATAVAERAAVILVVDDVESGRFVKGQILRRAGFDVVEADTGRAAIEIARVRAIDLAVLDVNLPDISGLEVCRVLKQEQGGPPAIQVLQISNTATSEADKVRGLRGGADVYLTEPVHPEVLVATTQSLLRVRRAEQAMAAALEREHEARREAEEANRLKDDFLAALSHELRTPLNAIMGWVWQLQRTGLSESARQRALSSLERNTRTQAQLINDLLDVSRIAKGKVQLDLQSVDLKGVVENSVELLREQAERKGLELSVDAEPIAVIGDAARLEQIVTNLISNAIQFTSQGRVAVSLSSEEGFATLRVADTGAGISPEFLPHVFDQFRQAEGGLSRQHGGLGLGLTIVRRLAELHGGTVRVESEGQGRGSTFIVRLATAIPHENTLPDTAPGPMLSNVHALLVEDDPDARELIAAMLEASGALTTTASSAEQALALASEQPFDVLVSDIGLPGTDGLTLVRQLRSRGFKMPAVAVSAFTASGDQRRILDSGFQVYTPKPVQPAELVKTIATLVRSFPPSDR
jgi:signal transduction histidine kinase